MDLREDDPKRVLFARQVAGLAASHGRKGLADEMMQRFDELDNDGNSSEANDGGTYVGDETGPSTSMKNCDRFLRNDRRRLHYCLSRSAGLRGTG